MIPILDIVVDFLQWCQLIDVELATSHLYVQAMMPTLDIVVGSLQSLSIHTVTPGSMTRWSVHFGGPNAEHTFLCDIWPYVTAETATAIASSVHSPYFPRLGLGQWSYGHHERPDVSLHRSVFPLICK